MLLLCVFFLIISTVKNTQTINTFYIVYAVIERVFVKRMNRKPDEFEYSFVDWSVKKEKTSFEDFAKKSQTVAQCERKMVVRCSMREIGFEIKWSLLTTAFIPTNIQDCIELFYAAFGIERRESKKKKETSSLFALCQCNACFTLFSVLFSEHRCVVRSHSTKRSKDYNFYMCK